ncbi:MAG TPA: bifunctional homocysteine S-methyltransferase/methylenetetrahydrofolate reductase [Streptosporangiaceae bacterium]|nr:bifunctional homocysteine S-methyltransferase/methylenetetrahydrofolate reductase [Streptosporangiaceae bacterium]
MTGFGEALGKRLLLCDGAMGTMLHASGCALDRALPEVNLTDPALVATIHESYLSAGADVIQTNTFGANRLWLAGHGYPDKVAEINRAAVRIARKVREHSRRGVFIAGSVSPAVTARQRRQVGAGERIDAIAEQVQALAAEGADLIILETFGYLDELAEAAAAASENCGLPIVAQATFADDGRTLGGETPREVASVLGELPVTMIGANCTTGPQRMLAVVENLVRSSQLPVSALPNAGQPRRVGQGRFEFSIDSAYFARYLRRFAEEGAAMVGGCCGTTPSHIEAAAASLAGLGAGGGRGPARPARQPARDQAAAAPGVLAARLASGEFVIAAGIPAADGGAAAEATDTVIALRDQGVGLFAVTAPDNPRAHRDSLGMAAHLQQRAGVEAIVTMTTWDKTIMTLQADLLGAHALGIRSIVCETGNPPVLGDYPAVDGVWEVDSLGLVSLLAGLNAGRDLDGLPLTTSTGFCIGSRINPGAPDLAAETARAKAEVQAGAQFLITRPVYDLAALRQMTEALAADQVPVLVSVTPLRSFEEADYLAHEVPDVCIPAATLRALSRAGHGAARQAGLELAAGLLREARPQVSGVVVTAGEDDQAVLGQLVAALG